MTPNPAPSIVTMGTFDGFHLGHKLLIDTLLRYAAIESLHPIAITFDRHPLATIAPDKAPKCISSPSERIRLLKEAGVEPVVVEFNEETRSLSAEQWIRRLAEDFKAKIIIIGHDNKFGCDGKKLTSDDYSLLAKKYGIKVITAPVEVGVSSSIIRKAIENGEIEKAEIMTGRPFELSGTVAHGDKVGRTIGFPTANVIARENSVIPGKGVYAAKAVTDDGIVMPAVVNIGNRPTIGPEKPLRIEAHIIGFKGDLYGRSLKLIFIRKLRDERKFDSLDQLKEAIENDKRMALSQ